MTRRGTQDDAKGESAPPGPKPVTGLTGDKAKRLAELRALQAKGELK